jgi:glycosyltransferase involved in cell wall biosynthesis
VTSVSVVIPTYNRATLLARAIESALGQTVMPAEVLVVDDGSTDHTRHVIAGFGSRVRYLFQENAGVSVARNTGVREASADWVAFLDSDDVWASDYLEWIVAAIEATRGEALLYFADLTEEGLEGTIWERSGFSIEGSHEFRPDPADWFMRPLQPMTTQATVIRRDAYLRVGGQRAEILCRQDTHLFLMLGFAGPACAVAGVAGVLTADADAGRLTGVHSPVTRSYCRDTIVLYGDLLGRCPPRRRDDRSELRQRLAGGYWHLARLEAGDGAIAAAISALARSFVTAPSVVLGKFKPRVLASAVASNPANRSLTA